MKKLCALIALFALSGCGMNNYAHNSLTRKGLQYNSTETFSHCSGYGCINKQEIIFTDKDWAPILALFTPPSSDPQQERERVAQAVGLFEQIAGGKAGTDTDKAGTFVAMLSKSTQQDCVDESLNTSVYLHVMQAKGLLKFHSAGMPMVKLPIIDSGRWPHQTAVMREISTNTDYVVDSWFHDNGFPAEIVTLQAWKEGWKPPKYRS